MFSNEQKLDPSCTGDSPVGEKEGSRSLSSYIEFLIPLEQVIYNLTEENFEFSVQKTINFFDASYPYSFNVIVISLVYYAFLSRRNTVDIYLHYLETIQTKEEEMDENFPKIIKAFINYLLKMNTQESYYLIEKMIERNIINENVTKKIRSKYFAHYTFQKRNKRYSSDPIEKTFNKNYKELSKDNWELHKQLIKDAVNPNEISKIIRNDEIEKLQEISSQKDFNFNQIIKPSLYERYSFINEDNVTLIDYAAFFSSIKCFKYLLMNNANIIKTGKYAVAGGNIEIIHLCEQNHSSFKKSYETAIMFHQNDIFKYIYENKFEKLKENNQQITLGNEQININNLIIVCIDSGNYEILSFLEKEMLVNENIINESAKTGNLYLVKYFLHNNQLPKNVLFKAITSGNIELVKYIVEQKEIDINAKDIFFVLFKICFNFLMFHNNIWKLLKVFNTALNRAAQKDQAEIFKLILEQGLIDINDKNIKIFDL